MSRSRLAVVLGVPMLILCGCAVTDYPLITDDRGDYSGIIRTGHKAYIVPSMQAAYVYPDGSDELFSVVYQNSYGDQRISTFNNFDPTGSVIFLDQTYCDWQFEQCELLRSWNPAHDEDRPFDYEFIDFDCKGWRSLENLISAARIGECGDRLGFRGNLQELAEAFASLDTTTWRGERAYRLPLDATNLSMTFEGASGRAMRMPIFGRYDFIVTDELQLVAPMTPNARHQRAWLAAWAAEEGPEATVRIDYRGVSAEHRIRLRPEGLLYNRDRY